MKQISMNNSNGEVIALKEAYERFRKIKIALNLSSETIKDYNSAYSYFAKFFDENRMCQEITEDIIYDYINHLKQKDISIITVNTYLRHLRAILYFCMERDYLKPFKIKLLECEKPIKHTYTDTEIDRLIEKPNVKKCNFSEYRNWVITCYLLATGNRLNTVINLKIEDVDFNNQEISLRKVKNKKPYSIPMSDILTKVLSEYLQYRGGSEKDYLFCTTTGQQFKKDGFREAIKRYNLSRGVSKTSIHLYRHTFAKNWVAEKGDPFRLQKILGHQTLDMTKEYVNMFGLDLKRDFEKYSILDKKMGSNGNSRIQMRNK